MRSGGLGFLRYLAWLSSIVSYLPRDLQRLEAVLLQALGLGLGLGLGMVTTLEQGTTPLCCAVP